MFSRNVPMYLRRMAIGDGLLKNYAVSGVGGVNGVVKMLSDVYGFRERSGGRTANNRSLAHTHTWRRVR